MIKKHLKTVWGTLVLSFIMGLYSCGENKNNDFENIKINQGWKFKLLGENNISEDNYHLADFNDSDWENIRLPHTANIEPLVVNDQWQGICWYRKELDVPSTCKGKQLTLEFEAAMNHSKVWINGMEVATHLGGYLPVIIDASKYLEPGEKNVIAVRLNNTDNPTTGPKPLKRLDFNMYGGLYRNAWLKVNNKVHITEPVLANKVAGGGVFITYPKVDEKESLVNIKTHVANTSKDDKAIKIVQSVYYKNELVKEEISEKVIISGDKDLEIDQQINIEGAKLWSPEFPNLYSLETKVLSGDVLLDEKTNRFGIREYTFKDNQLYVNGKKTFLRGVNRHQEYPFVGYALSDNAQYRDAKKIKDGGFNYIRLSHYPHSPSFMDACDELGLIVIDAILGWQYYLDNDAFRNYCYTSAKDLIRRDRNHPCVLAWEVSLNETKMPVFFMEKLNDIVHDEYPGDNVYSCGWMDDVYDIYLQARQHRILHPHELKDKPYSVSEYGDWEYYSKNAGLNQDLLSNDLRDEFSSRQAREFGEQRLLYQVKNVHEAHNDNLTTPAYSDSYWVMYDYNRGYHDNIEYSGLMDIFRLPKFAYYFYQSQRDVEDGVVLEIASYWNEKSPLNVQVFSNCDKVKLYLNDKILISEQSPDTDKNSTKINHPPFTFKLPSFKKGTLKAVGLINGKEVAEDIVNTPGEVSKLKIWIDESGKKAVHGENDVVFVYIAGIDANGTLNPDFSEKMDVKITGDAKIVNVGSIKAEAGIATAVMRIGDTPGEITVSAKLGNGNLSGEFEFNTNLE